jgi:hypothetical protein
MEMLDPWYEDRNPALGQELRSETCQGHVLYELPVSPLARRQDCDDILFALEDGTGRVAVVHLTYSKETDPFWPRTELFPSLVAWLPAMISDHDEFCG